MSKSLNQTAISLGFLLLLSSGLGLACMGDRPPPPIPVYSQLAEHLPAGASTPEQRELLIGSLLNLAVPKGAHVTLTTLAKGSMEPLEWVDDATYARIDRKRLDAREPFSIPAKPDTLDVRHLLANSFGKAQLDINDPSGSRRLIIGVIYEAPVPQGKPTPLKQAGKGAAPSFSRSVRQAGIWLKVPGRVADGWQLQQAKDNDFAILRIEQLEVPYDDPPAVGIFVHGSSSMKSGELALVSGNLVTRRKYPFKVVVMPTPAC